MRSSILHIWELILNDNLQTFKDRPTVSYNVVNIQFIFLLKTSAPVSTFFNSDLKAGLLMRNETTLPIMLQINLHKSSKSNE